MGVFSIWFRISPSNSRGLPALAVPQARKLQSKNGCTRLRLTHAGIATEVACDGHKRAWPSVLEHLEKQLDRSSSKPAVAGDANGKIYTVFGSGTTGTQ
jgi:hypothetical protein